MNPLDVLKAGAVAADELVKFLNRIAQEVPSLAPKAQELIGKLTSPLAPSNLTAIGTAVVSQIGDMAHGKFDPHDSPSNRI